MAQMQSAVTTPEVEPFFFQWTIEKFSLLKEIGSVKSDLFHTFHPVPAKWQMVLHPKGIGEGSPDHLSLILNCNVPQISKAELPVIICTMTIKSTGNEDYRTEPLVKDFLKYHSSSFGTNRFISLREFEENAGLLLPGDTLTLICKGDIVIKVNQAKGQQRKQSIDIPASGLLKDVENMLVSDVGRDVTLVAGNSEFAVHKFILCARSPVFAAMFAHDTLENSTGKVVIEDVEPTVLEGLIYYVYTDSPPPNIRDIAGDLMAAADRYELLRLKAICAAQLVNALKVDDVLSVLSFAIKLNCDQLKKVCLRFTKANIEEVVHSSSWRDVECVSREALAAVTMYVARK